MRKRRNVQTPRRRATSGTRVSPRKSGHDQDVEDVPILDKWKIAREMIVHEDALTSQRITWILQYNGFLFAAVGLVIGALNHHEVKNSTAILMYGLFGLAACALGVRLSGASHEQLKGAFQQLRVITSWWHGQVKGELANSFISQKKWEELLAIEDDQVWRARLAELSPVLDAQKFPPIRNTYFRPLGFRKHELPWIFRVGWLSFAVLLIANMTLQHQRIQNNIGGVSERDSARLNRTEINLCIDLRNVPEIHLTPADETAAQPAPSPWVRPAEGPKKSDRVGTDLPSVRRETSRTSNITLPAMMLTAIAGLISIVACFSKRSLNT